MSGPVFAFTRNPSVKVSVATSITGLTAADNELTLVGRMATAGGSAVANIPQVINNYGDPVAAAVECATYFGAGSELGAMVVAAISAVLYSNLAVKVFSANSVFTAFGNGHKREFTESFPSEPHAASSLHWGSFRRDRRCRSECSIESRHGCLGV